MLQANGTGTGTTNLYLDNAQFQTREKPAMYNLVNLLHQWLHWASARTSLGQASWDCGENEKVEFRGRSGYGRTKTPRAGRQVMVDAGSRPAIAADIFSKHQITHSAMEVQQNVPGMAWSTFLATATAVKGRAEGWRDGKLVRCLLHVGSPGCTSTLSTNVNVLAC